MRTQSPRTARWLALLLVCSGIVTTLAPVGIAHAQSLKELSVGGSALVGNTGGEGVLLREGPGYDARVLSTLPDGNAVAVLDGPIAAEDGSIWFGVNAAGLDGYLDASYLIAGDAGAAPSAAAPIPNDGVDAGRAGDAATSANPGTTTISANAPDMTSSGAGDSRPAPSDLAGEPNGSSSSEQPVEPRSAPVDDAAPAGAGGTATTNDVVNLRAAPDPNADVPRVLPPGSEVTITGEPTNGFTPVWYNGTDGFIMSQYLDEGYVDAAQRTNREPANSSTSTTFAPAATVTANAELKAAPDAASATIGNPPIGTSFEQLRGPENGFYEVDFEGQSGWLPEWALELAATPAAEASTPPPSTETSADGATPVSGDQVSSDEVSQGLIWPVKGGTWSIMQGYNGSSHTNQDELWQYQYALDLVRKDGNTAGQTVYAPASGSVRWTDPGSGGIAIDIGNGHAVFLCHLEVDGNLTAGTRVNQGQAIASISGSGGPGFAGTPHVHVALWESSDGGNWDRHAVPFTGKYALGGEDLPDTGGGQQHRGLEFTP